MACLTLPPRAGFAVHREWRLRALKSTVETCPSKRRLAPPSFAKGEVAEVQALAKHLEKCPACLLTHFLAIDGPVLVRVGGIKAGLNDREIFSLIKSTVVIRIVCARTFLALRRPLSSFVSSLLSLPNRPAAAALASAISSVPS